MALFKSGTLLFFERFKNAKFISFLSLYFDGIFSYPRETFLPVGTESFCSCKEGKDTTLQLNKKLEITSNKKLCQPGTKRETAITTLAYFIDPMWLYVLLYNFHVFNKKAIFGAEKEFKFKMVDQEISNLWMQIKIIKIVSLQ